MDPRRYAEIQAYIDATSAGSSPPAGIQAPTSEEIAQFGVMNPPGGGGAPRVQNIRYTPPPGQGGDLTPGSRYAGNEPSIKPPAYPPNPSGGPMSSSDLTGLPPSQGQTGIARRPTSGATPAAAGGTATGASGGNTYGGGSSYGGNTGATGGAGTEPAGSVRSLWSQALQDARIESGGDPRALRIPFEQHPQGGVFANYQNVAQPGFGPNVPSRMPGQGGPPQMGGRPPMPQAGGQVPMPQRQAPPPQQGGYSSPLAQMAATPAIPGGPPPMPSPGQRPMQQSFGQGRPVVQPGFAQGQPVASGYVQGQPYDPRQRY